MTDHEQNNWIYFNYNNILIEAKLRLMQAEKMGTDYEAFKPEFLTLEYWTAHCAFNNLSSIYS